MTLVEYLENQANCLFCFLLVLDEICDILLFPPPLLDDCFDTSFKLVYGSNCCCQRFLITCICYTCKCDANFVFDFRIWFLMVLDSLSM